MASQINVNSMKKRGCIADALWERFWRARQNPNVEVLCLTRLLGVVLIRSPLNMRPKGDLQIDDEKVYNMTPTVSQHGVEIYAQTNSKDMKKYYRERQENHGLLNR